MKMTHLFATAAMALATATGANAANLISADVTGPSGTIWTTRDTGNYTLFLQTPGLGDFLNPNDEAINYTPAEGINRVLLAGEGFRPGETINSDAIYTLTLNFDDGATITGDYTPLTNSFVGGSSTTVGNTTYSLIEFSFTRTLGDSVSPNVAVPGGNGNDYAGNFRFDVTTAAVPEPASWALMIGGFGVAGASLRRRRAATTVKFA
ncbi:PEPxxWA-CTERM sorting domain-containing protein [Sphingomonas sp. 1P06PA]|uniref:PEPxxWA-CTERM sorting domain-containing protein n=1 Tax=Sphingomonas sp. 1P06PA TaxID=554121 RepID=UPI0039A6AB0F